MNVLHNVVEVYRIFVLSFGSISASIIIFNLFAILIATFEPKNKFLYVLDDINGAFSRNTSEFDEHWCWWSGKPDDPQYQVTNCSSCGDYVISNSLGNNLPKNIVCKCKKYKFKNINIDYYSDDYSDYYSDDDY